jgi:two-component system, NtrC family, nitrogen regulation sensor histidine kinase NtrY
MSSLVPSRPRLFWGIAAFLAAMLPISLVVMQWQVSTVESTVGQRQDEQASAALDHVDREFRQFERRLHDRARSLAEDQDVVRLLRERERGTWIQPPEELIDIAASASVNQRQGIEIHDLSPRVVAWNGVSVPMDAAPSSDRFLSTYQTSVVEDGDRRVALVAWWPIRDGTRVLGAVRAVEVVRLRVPVQNQFISDYDLTDTWQRQIRLPIRIDYRPQEADATGKTQSRVLQGSDGSVLGRVHVEPPSLEAVVSDTRDRYQHVSVFWATLLAIWLTFGLWTTYAAPGKRSARFSPSLRLGAFVIWLIGLRYVLIHLDVPARWQRGKAPLAPLFDPAHLASTFGGGIMRSTGDLVLTAIFALLIASAVVHYRLAGRGYSTAELRRKPPTATGRRYVFGALAVGLAACSLLTVFFREIVRHSLLDSTLDYFSRATLVPSSLELVVIAALIMLGVAAAMLAACAIWPGLRHVVLIRVHQHGLPRRMLAVVGAILIGLVLAARFFVPDELVGSIAILVLIGLVIAWLWTRERQVDLLYLRSILPALFLITIFIYPLLYEGLDTQRRIQMQDAADTFAEGRDPRVMFALEQALREATSARQIDALLADDPSPEVRSKLDSLASVVVRTSLLGSLGGYEVSLTFIGADGQPRGRHVESEHAGPRAVQDEMDAAEFVILRQMYAESAATGSMVEQVTGRRDPGRLQYEGIRPLSPAGLDPERGWVMARAEPRSLLHDYHAPFPRVLLPASTYESMYAGLSIAEFRDGVIVRNVGREFGRYRLGDDVWDELRTGRQVWRREAAEGQAFITYYQRQDPIMPAGAVRETAAVTAVRMPAVNVFDHLFYLLRVTVAGLFLAIPLFLVGLLYRWEIGWLPAPQVRFRDKVLNAFLAVGILAVAVVGFIGLQLVTGENERSIQNWLRQHLDRVEETLVLEARPDEMPYRVLERMNIDSLAARVGLDINVYQGPWLLGSSRPQLIRERLINDRLPIDAYRALFQNGFRFASSVEQVGTFTYTAGFQALPDEQGVPRYVISVPTLPEQERIEEERARTVAYLFGALLLLVLVVMITASVLAGALARPVARLREGLESVAHGKVHQPLPVDSRDEIGELVGTFNEMQRQLVESRRKLAQQERQLAWREMARQVAHEIKNPLTPMKLSVQHLRRAHEAENATGDGAVRAGKFDRLFERITTTLIEQIDALARIANEFHTFARLPSRVLERLDLNEVAMEAIALMQEETQSEVRLESAEEELMVNADREELRRVFINLLKNAMQAIPPEREGSILVASRQMTDRNGEAWAEAAIIDNGTGIPVELQDKIFEPNFSTKTSGTGLGLAITRKSIEEMQGTIEFQTTVGEGSRFTLRLPLAKTTQPQFTR